MAAKRGAKMMFANTHTIGAMGRPKRSKGKPAKRGAAAVTGTPVAKAKGPGK